MTPFWSNLLSSLGSALFGVGLNYGNNRLNNMTLTGAQQEQNAFNAQQAQAQRDWAAQQNQAIMNFNSAEAEKNRSFQADQAQNQMRFQERMDNSVYQRRVNDMQAAGINPALAVGGISVGSTSGASGSGSMASASGLAGVSASGSSPSFPGSMSDLMSAAMLKKNVEQVDAQIRRSDAQTLRDLAEEGLLQKQTIGQDLENTWYLPKTEAQIANLESDLRSKGVQRALQRQDIKESQAREALYLTQNIIAKADADTRDELNRAALSETLKRATYYEALGNEASVRASSLVPAEVNELYQRAIMEGMQAGKFSAEEYESMERAGLIREQTEGQRIGNASDYLDFVAKDKHYQIYKPKLEYWLGLGSTAFGITGQLLGGIGRGLAGAAVAKKINTDLFNTKGLKKQGSGLILPNSVNAFGAQYRFRD